MDVKTGGMGIVYLCRNESENERVALKTFQLKSPDLWRPVLESFIRETKTWILIGAEPNVVQAYYILNVEIDGNLVPHLAIELIEGDPAHGCSLRDWIQIGAITLKHAALFADGICAGMNQIQRRLSRHGIDFIHRDLKPENILITRDGIAKITDFGLAKSFQSTTARTDYAGYSSTLRSSYFASGPAGSRICGTPPYMSPEQCLGKILDQRSDIYAFGCILYEMCTGHMLFNARTPEEFIRGHTEKRPITPNSWNPQLPGSLTTLIINCLEKDPRNRPNDFAEVTASLRPILDELGCSKPLSYFMFGLSAFTDRPRIRGDWNWDRTTEAMVLGKPYGIDYVIREGLVKDRAEYDALWTDFQEKGLTKKPEQRELEKRQREGEELLKMGDALRALADNPNGPERVKLFEDALGKYRGAQRRLPNETQINFRLAITYRDIAELIRQNLKTLSDDLLVLAFEEFRVICGDSQPITLFFFNEQGFVLPYHALIHRAGAHLVKGNVAAASDDINKVLTSLDKWTEKKYEGLRALIKEQATGLRQNIPGVIKFNA